MVIGESTMVSGSSPTMRRSMPASVARRCSYCGCVVAHFWSAPVVSSGSIGRLGIGQFRGEKNSDWYPDECDRVRRTLAVCTLSFSFFFFRMGNA
ncbi:MAG: hypothetical protein ACI9OJ_000989 [Myxococcota bacterium]|jgi:hypothetical protein